MIPVAVVLVLAVVVGFVREFSGDFHWHTVLGEETLRLAAPYRVETLSHTHLGQTMFISAWFGDVVLALAFRGGYAVCYALRGLVVACVVAFSLREMIRRGLSAPAAAALALFVLGWGMFSFYLRPEMFSFLCLAALLHVLGEHERRGYRRQLGWALALLLLWVNLHGSVLFGLAALGLYAVERSLRALCAGSARLALRWLALPLGAALVACANPEGVGALLSFRILGPTCAQRNADWLPVPLAHPPAMLVAAALALAVTSLAAAPRVSPWRLALALALGWAAQRHQRFVLPALIGAAPLVAGNLAVIRDRLRATARARAWRAAGAGLTALVAAWGGFTLLGERRLFTEVGLGVDPGAYPEAAARWALDAGPRGKLLNAYNIGSFLLYRLGRRYPVFIDQRACSLYRDAFLNRYLQAMEGPPAGFRALVDETGVSWAFVEYDPIARQLSGDPQRWRLVYFDDGWLIYVRTDDGQNDALVVQGYVWLDPVRLFELPDLSGDERAAARAELARQRQACPACERTLLAAAALAAGDAEFRAARDALLARREGPELAYLAARDAEKRGDFAHAAVLYQRIRALGGDPLQSLIQEAGAWARAGDRDRALRLLDQAARLPGGAPAASRALSELR